MDTKLKKDDKTDPENRGKKCLETATEWGVGTVKGSGKQSTSMRLSD